MSHSPLKLDHKSNNGLLTRPAVIPRNIGIQALRAVAVLSVVVYHLEPAMLPGGFTGVDIFFVISGFLITSLLLKELQRTGRVGLVKFWKKRAARLLPAQITVILISLGASLVVFPVSHFETLFSQTASAVLNVHNWALGAQSVNYLAQDGVDNPLDHYWSLSIEEQFYVVLPLLLAFAIAFRLPRTSAITRVRFVVVLGTLVSLTTMLISSSNGVASDYFSTGHRAWQLGAGGILALTASRCIFSSKVRRFFLCCGAALILTSFVIVTGESGYPSIAALVPTVGALLCILAFTGGEPIRWPRLVTSPITQSVGNASYSIYLVHWPVIVLTNYAMVSQTSSTKILVQLACTVLFSYLIHSFIEDILRRRQVLDRRILTLATVVVASIALLGIFGSWIFSGAQYKDRTNLVVGENSPYGAAAFSEVGDNFFVSGDSSLYPSPETAGALDTPLWGIEECQIEPNESTPVRCDFGRPGSKKLVVLAGDSHASQWLPPLQEIAEYYDWHLVTFLHSSCAFSAVPRAYTSVGQEACSAGNAATMRLIQKLPKVSLLITSALSGDSFAGSTSNPSVGAEGFSSYWSQLNSLGIPIVAIRDNPQYMGNGKLLDCVRRNISSLAKCSLSPEESLRVDQQVKAVEDTPGASLVDLGFKFCRKDACPAVVGNVLVYRDNNHLTATYARSLFPDLRSEIRVACNSGPLSCESIVEPSDATAIADFAFD